MKKSNYYFKYIEYLLKKIRCYFTTDLHFHTVRLKKVIANTPNIKKPLTLNEKICHRLVFDHNPLFTMLADKIAVRDYVRSRTQRVKIATLYGVYTAVEDIDFTPLPDKFVLKCNHDCGSTVVCTNKANFNSSQAANKLRLALKKNVYYSTREWQYKNIPPRILCEQYINIYLNTERNKQPEMLRVHCFHGVPNFIEADFTDESGNGFINVYDETWSLQPFQMEYPNTPEKIDKPALFHEALLASRELSRGIDYCRVDLMLTQKDIYFSEITLSPRRGKLNISPIEWDMKLGAIW